MPRRVARALHNAWDEPPGLGGMERGDSVRGGAEPGTHRNVRGKAMIVARGWVVERVVG